MIQSLTKPKQLKRFPLTRLHSPKPHLPSNSSSGFRPLTSDLRNAFTIVELLIVIVIIAILATITIIAYNGITNLAHESTIKSDLKTNNDALQIHYALHGSYPTTGNESALNDNRGLANSGDNTVNYTSDGTSYCLVATYGDITYSSTDTEQSPQEGGCGAGGGAPIVITDGDFLQDVTTDNCPDTRTRAVDARDNHTYWIQKLADGNCWMLTNLAYAGGTSNGGTDTYGDVIPTGNGTGGTLNGPDNSGSYTYTEAKYYTPTGANPTTEPTNPSTSTNGTGQYGYLYNWCAAMAGQSTSACANASTPLPVPSQTICPSNWRLPTGTPTTGEFTSLTTAIGATNNPTGSTNLRSAWLAQYGGIWYDGSFTYQGSYGYYWSSSQDSGAVAHSLYFSSSNVDPASNNNKRNGRSVRCVIAV